MDRFSWLMGCVPSVGKFDRSLLKHARIGALATLLVLLLASNVLARRLSSQRESSEFRLATL